MKARVYTAGLMLGFFGFLLGTKAGAAWYGGEQMDFMDGVTVMTLVWGSVLFLREAAREEPEK